MGLFDKFKKNKIYSNCKYCGKEKPEDTIPYCRYCLEDEDRPSETPLKLPTAVYSVGHVTEHNENWLSDVDKESPLDAIIEIHYIHDRIVNSRLFFSDDTLERIYSKDFLSSTQNNFMVLKINPTKKGTSASWVKPKDTGKIQGDNFESGYTLMIKFAKDDRRLRKQVIDLLNGINFGCLVSNYTLHCHKNSESISEPEAKELLDSIIQEIKKIQKLDDVIVESDEEKLDDDEESDIIHNFVVVNYDRYGKKSTNGRKGFSREEIRSWVDNSPEKHFPNCSCFTCYRKDWIRRKKERKRED